MSDTPYFVFRDEQNTQPQEAESTFATIGRGAGRSAARIGETLAGLPGDVISGLLNLGELGYQTIGQTKESPYGETIQGIRESLPTSSRIRERVTKPIAEAIGGSESYFEPQGSTEQLLDNILETFTGLAVPGGITGKGLKSAAKLSLGSNLLGLATKKVTGSETAGDTVKIGTLLAAPWIGIPSMKDKAISLFNKIKQASYNESTISAQPFADAANKVLTSGVRGKEASKAGKQLTEWINESGASVLNPKKGSVGHIVDLYQGFNNYLNENNALKNAPQLYKPIKKSLLDTLEHYGASNPEFIKDFKAANELYSEAFKANRIYDWMKSKLPNAFTKKLENKPLLQMLGIPIGTSTLGGLAGGLAKGKLGAAGLGAGIGGTASLLGHFGIKGLNRAIAMYEKPAVRNHAFQAMKAAANGNRTGFLNAVKHLDKDVGQFKENEPYYTFRD